MTIRRCCKPAILLAFDLVRHAGIDLADKLLGARRTNSAGGVAPARPPASAVDCADSSHEEAEDWFNLLPGIEGVVAKREDSRYLPGERGWIKVKRQHTADCVVIGISGNPAPAQPRPGPAPRSRAPPSLRTRPGVSFVTLSGRTGAPGASRYVGLTVVVKTRRPRSP
jgi:hypothetical protein